MSIITPVAAASDPSSGNTGQPGERESGLVNDVPLPYSVVDGKKFPLPGSHSVFLTGDIDRGLQLISLMYSLLPFLAEENLVA